MSWIGAILVSIGKRLAPAAVIWYFSRERGAAARDADRQMWWKFKLRADSTKTKVDDALATYWQARCDFHDSPEAKASKIAMDAVEATRAKFSGPHQP